MYLCKYKSTYVVTNKQDSNDDLPLRKLYMWKTLYEVILHFITFSSQFEVWTRLNAN